MTSDFPDVSHWNASADFAGIRNAGATQVVLKATQGRGYDPLFNTRWAAAKAAGLKRGAYCFADAGVDPVAAAQALHAVAGDAELPLILDWEDSAVSVGWCQSFLKETDRLTGKLSIIYMPQSWTPRAAGLVHWSLWAARYNRTLGPVAPFTRPMWWQYTDAGTIGPFHGDVSHQQYAPVVDPPSAGVVPSDSPEKIRFLQVLLTILGKYNGPLDGKFDAEVGEAVRRFKHAWNSFEPPANQLSESEARGWMVGPKTLTAIATMVNLVSHLKG